MPIYSLDFGTQKDLSQRWSEKAGRSVKRTEARLVTPIFMRNTEDSLPGAYVIKLAEN